jgi:hypothetical protein
MTQKDRRPWEMADGDDEIMSLASGVVLDVYARAMDRLDAWKAHEMAELRLHGKAKASYWLLEEIFDRQTDLRHAYDKLRREEKSDE